MIEGKLSLKQRKRLHIFGAALFLCLALVGCKKKEDTLGLGVYPEGEQFGLITTDTFTINATTVLLDSVRSDDLELALLGSIIDPEFGMGTASVSAQFQPSTNTVDFGNISSLIVDSVSLSLVYSGYYGRQSSQQFLVNELTQDIYKDSAYYSSRVFQLSSENLLSKTTYLPNYTRKGIAAGDEPEQLKMRMNNDFGQRLINQTIISADGETFVKEFKGVHIASDVDQSFTSVATGGWGAIWLFDLANEYSRIKVYYHNDTDTSSYDYIFTDDLTRVNHFTHNYSGFSVESAITNAETGEALLYMQGMAGVAVDFDIPYLEGIVDDGPVTINKAELVFTVEDGTTDTYVPELNYVLRVKTEGGNYTQTIDQLDGQYDAGGELNTENEYRFLVNRDVQFLANNFTEGNDYNFGYRLVSISSATEPGRTILKGTKAGTGEVKLIVSYTPI
jgi:hypothetical protein